jgi:molybdopterin molybdotransferase
MVCRQVENIGAEPIYFGTLPDDYGRCFRAVKEALNEVDFLITTGGASVGDYDYIGKILQDLEADVLFNKVAMRPGSVTTVAVRGEQWIFGLSGNPASCFVGLELFVRPVLKSALGANNLHLARCRAILREAVPTANPYTRFMRGIVETDGHRLVTRSAGIDKPGMVTALSKANALIVIPGGSPPLDAGAEVDVLLLDG